MANDTAQAAACPCALASKGTAWAPRMAHASVRWTGRFIGLVEHSLGPNVLRYCDKTTVYTRSTRYSAETPFSPVPGPACAVGLMDRRTRARPLDISHRRCSTSLQHPSPVHGLFGRRRQREPLGPPQQKAPARPFPMMALLWCSVLGGAVCVELRSAKTGGPWPAHERHATICLRHACAEESLSWSVPMVQMRRRSAPVVSTAMVRSGNDLLYVRDAAGRAIRTGSEGDRRSCAASIAAWTRGGPFAPCLSMAWARHGRTASASSAAGRAPLQKPPDARPGAMLGARGRPHSTAAATNGTPSCLHGSAQTDPREGEVEEARPRPARNVTPSGPACMKQTRPGHASGTDDSAAKPHARSCN